MKKYLLILISLLLVSCDFNKYYKDREEDKQEAEHVTARFYSLIEENNKPEALTLFSDKFFQVTDRDKLNQMIEDTQREYGKMKNYNLSQWETLVVKGSNPKSEYLLTYNVQRDTVQTQETFSLQKENNKIKIIGYKINYDIYQNK